MKRFLALWSRYGLKRGETFPTQKQAKKFLTEQSDAALIFPITVYDTKEDKIIWKNEALSDDMVMARVRKHLTGWY